jgi:hypothetical protein
MLPSVVGSIRVTETALPFRASVLPKLFFELVCSYPPERFGAAAGVGEKQ